MDKPQLSLPKRPLRPTKWILSLVMIAGLVISVGMTGADFGEFFANLDQFGAIFGEMAKPDWSYSYYVIAPLIETIKMAVLGTVIGSALAFPYALLISRNIIKNRIITSIFRFILNIVRTIPDLLLGAIFVAIVGIGPVAGIISLAFFTFGMVGKLFYEAVETIDEGPIEALTAAGANKFQIIQYAVFPQIQTYFISYVLYAFEINVRASAVLGYIGAGGIGMFLQRSLSLYRYDQTGLIVLVIFAVVLVIDYVSNISREALIK